MLLRSVRGHELQAAQPSQFLTLPVSNVQSSRAQLNPFWRALQTVFCFLILFGRDSTPVFLGDAIPTQPSWTWILTSCSKHQEGPGLSQLESFLSLATWWPPTKETQSLLYRGSELCDQQPPTPTCLVADKKNTRQETNQAQRGC